ncbi:MAG: hypothetical protein R3E79_59015 [Caldilineaceae bacterium]
MKTSLKTWALTALLVLTLNGCQPITNTGAETAVAMPLSELLIHAHDYSYDLPKEIAAGIVRITIDSDGKEPHHAQLARLNDGVTQEQFLAAMQESFKAMIPLVSFTGGPAPIDAGGSQTVLMELTAGNYVVLCFIPSADGLPHLAKGMIGFFEVVTGENKTAAPTADATVELLDFSYRLPENIKAGKQLWSVVNRGTQLHEINLMKLAEGKTLDDVMAWMMQPAGPPPFLNVGGFQGINPSATGWMELDLAAGQYIAICHIPDPATGKAHEELGMVLPFTVTE